MHQDFSGIWVCDGDKPVSSIFLGIVLDQDETGLSESS